MNTEKIKGVDLMTPEYAEHIWNKVEIICPTIDDNFKLIFKLKDNKKCPINLDGECSKCEHFMATSSEEGTYFSYGVYDGYCNTKNKTDKKDGE